MSFKIKAARLLKSFTATSNRQEAVRAASYLAVEVLEPRMMLSGTVETLIFQADFEDVDVDKGSFAFFAEVSGLTASVRTVEVQNNPPSVGPAASGDQHLELDGVNAVFVDLTPTDNDLRLQFEYSARPGVNADFKHDRGVLRGSVYRFCLQRRLRFKDN